MVVKSNFFYFFMQQQEVSPLRSLSPMVPNHCSGDHKCSPSAPPNSWNSQYLTLKKENCFLKEWVSNDFIFRCSSKYQRLGHTDIDTVFAKSWSTDNSSLQGTPQTMCMEILCICVSCKQFYHHIGDETVCNEITARRKDPVFVFSLWLNMHACKQ